MYEPFKKEKTTHKNTNDVFSRDRNDFDEQEIRDREHSQTSRNSSCN